MKKLVYRAEAVIMAALLFFCTILYNAIPVYGFTMTFLIQQLGWLALGYAVNEYVFEPISQQLGWTSADIQVDENGNVILSESQMQELKDAIEGYAQDENGNDLYGATLWPSEVPEYNSVTDWLIARGLQDRTDFPGFTPGPVTGGGCVWSSYPYYSVNGNVKGVYYVKIGFYDNVGFYDSSGSAVMFGEGYCFRYDYPGQGGKGWGNNGSFSSFSPENYCGPQVMAFPNLSSLQRYIEDGSPYELITPTYTGGDFIIPADQLHDPNNPSVSDNDFDDYGNPVTEKGWLQKIYERLGDILDQVKQIKWLTLGDVVINAIDTFGESVGNITGALVESVSMVFPLCIAWDFVQILTIFVADPVEPIFEIPLKYEPIGLDVTFTIDLTDWDWAVKMFRVFELLVFIAGLFELTVSWVGRGDDV